jgi:hypothetical protein
VAGGMVRVYRDWVGHRLGSPMRRVRSYFRAPPRRNDLSSRHDPATAIPDDHHWYSFIDDLPEAVIIPLWLLLCGLVEAGVCAAIAAGWFITAFLLPQSWTVVVERDGEIIERRAVVGWWRSRSLLRQLQDQYG